MAAVLVVDDEPDVLATVGMIIQNAGHTVATAINGIAALDAFDQGGHFDLLVTDVIMPGLNGFNLARMAKTRHRAIRVLYLTGYHEHSLALSDQGQRYGKLLIKPILPDDLRREVGAALSGQSVDDVSAR